MGCNHRVQSLIWNHCLYLYSGVCAFTTPHLPLFPPEKKKFLYFILKAQIQWNTSFPSSLDFFSFFFVFCGHVENKDVLHVYIPIGISSNLQKESVHKLVLTWAIISFTT
jgi:hypothetical protein